MAYNPIVNALCILCSGSVALAQTGQPIKGEAWTWEGECGPCGVTLRRVFDIDADGVARLNQPIDVSGVVAVLPAEAFS